MYTEVKVFFYMDVICKKPAKYEMWVCRQNMVKSKTCFRQHTFTSRLCSTSLIIGFLSFLSSSRTILSLVEDLLRERRCGVIVYIFASVGTFKVMTMRH